MNERHIGLYLVVPGLSVYACLLLYFIYNLIITKHTSEDIIILLAASTIIIAPTCIGLINMGKKYLDVFHVRFFPLWMFLPFLALWFFI